MAACGWEGLRGESAGRRGTAERLVSAHSTVTVCAANLTAHMPPQSLPTLLRTAGLKVCGRGETVQGFWGP